MEFETYNDFVYYVIEEMAEEQDKTKEEVILSLMDNMNNKEEVLNDLIDIMLEKEFDRIADCIDEYAEEHNIKEFEE